MRKLIYVPILHSSADLGSIAGDVANKGTKLLGLDGWERHLNTINLFWNSIENYFHGLNANGFKIFQDGLVVGEEVGEKIVNAASAKGSRNYALIRKMVAKGAKVMRTEDLSLVKREVVYIGKLAKSKSLIEKLVAYLHYKASKRGLLKERDRFIAKTINSSLKEGETGLLFLGAFHNVLPMLAQDIEVEELKERKKVAAYQKIFYLKSKEGERKRLEKYLTAPVEGWAHDEKL